MKVLYASDIQQSLFVIPRRYVEGEVNVRVHNEQTADDTFYTIQVTKEFGRLISYISHPFECGCSYLIEITETTGELLLREKVYASSVEDIKDFDMNDECNNLTTFTDFLYQDGVQVGFMDFSNQIFKKAI